MNFSLILKIISADSMVTMAQSTALAQHTYSHGSHTFTHTLTSTQIQPHCVKRQLSYYRIWNQMFILKVPEGGPRANRSTRRKLLTACPLIGITIPILEEKIQHPGRESNPRTL